MTKAERRNINIANAKKSTGPKTEAGKNISKYNAVRHGLCSLRKVHAKDESENRNLQRNRLAYQSEHLPKTLEELECVITMVEIQWQLLRVRRLIEFTFDRGLDVFIVSKTIDNFSRHQGRLHRLYARAKTELKELQEVRKKAEKEALATGAAPQQENDLQEIGFVLPIPDPSDPDADPQDYGPDEESVFPQHIYSEITQPEEIRA